jgi:5-methylcytosine-specific restriction endonuclease McrA
MSIDTLNQPVLLLNVNYEPLNICNTRRALVLVFADKADIVLNGRGKVRSSSAEFDLPSVIRLRYMVRRPRPRVSLNKREVLRRDEFTCQYCNRQTTFLTIDHVVPRHAGGSHTWENLVAACPACNRRKGGKTLQRTDMQLLREPFEPRPTANYRFGRYLNTHSEWIQFIEGW